MEPAKEKIRKYKIILILFIIFVFNILVVCCERQYSSTSKINIGGEDIVLKEPEVKDDIVMTKIPGYDHEILNHGNKELYLINPERNQVYFLYEVEVKNKVIYRSDLIPPNKMVKADLYSLLDAGNYETTLHISTFDIHTNEPCNAANVHMKLQILK